MIQPAKRRLETMVCGPSTSISGTDRLAVLVTANLDVRDCGKCLTQAIPTSTNNRRKRFSLFYLGSTCKLSASGQWTQWLIMLRPHRSAKGRHQAVAMQLSKPAWR